MRSCRRTVGAPPAPRGSDFQLPINTKGRLSTEEEFSNIIVRADPATGALMPSRMSHGSR